MGTLRRSIAPQCLVVALALVSVPSAVGAKPDCDRVPEGNSEVDEYSETIPGACGDQDSDSGGSGSEQGGTLPAGTEAELQSAGADGEALADLVKSSGSGGDGPSSGGDNVGGAVGDGDGAGPAAASLDGSPAAEVGRVLGGSDEGVGWLLPLILGLTVLAGALFLLARHRSRTE